MFPTLQAAGITLPLTCVNGRSIVHQLDIYDVLLKRVGSVQAIQEGLNEVGIIDLARQNPELMKTALTLKETVLDAEVFLSLINMPKQVDEDQKRAVDFLCKFCIPQARRFCRLVFSLSQAHHPCQQWDSLASYR